MFDNMFSNIGTTIKRITKNFCLVGMGLSIVCGLIIAVLGMFGGEMSLFIAGLIGGLVGVVIFWLGSLTLYAYGELVENSCIQTELLLRIEKHYHE